MDNAPLDPYAYVSTRPTSRALNVVRNRLRDAWDDDPDFFTKFFPVNARIRRIYGEYQKELRHRSRWKGIPSTPKTASKLYAPISNLFGRVLQACGLYEDARRMFNTSKNHTELNANYPVWPSLLLAGSGKHFACSTVPRPLPDYALGISVLEVRLDKEDETRARDRLAASMQQLFAHQYNRRYAFGLVISEHTLTVHMFDRSGVLSSPSLDYHSHPEQFCAIVAGLASTEASHLGLDTSISRDGIKCVIRTREPAANKRKMRDIIYTLVANLYYASDFVGRGTTCFAAYEEAAPNKAYVIKDAWVRTEELEGKESEASLIAHARRRGVTLGIPEIRHEEEVRIKGLIGHTGIDSIHNNRQYGPLQHSKIERVHTRLIMSPFGKPLDRFSTRKELLVAYYDAVQGVQHGVVAECSDHNFLAHRNLYEVGGILHRDIKPGNILINPKGEEGNRGVLIDFDHAIRTDDKSPYSTKKKIGTYLFMSRNALKAEEEHTYLDDLESFYYMLVFIVLAHTGPGAPTKDLPERLTEWLDPMASGAKNGFLIGFPPPRVEKWFGAPFQTLLDHLHTLFQNMTRQKIIAEHSGNPPPVVNCAETYDAIISHIRQAIVDLSLETAPGDPKAVTSHCKRRLGEDAQESTSIVFSWMEYSNPKKRRQKGILTTSATVATSRGRRSQARYGTTRHRL